MTTNELAFVLKGVLQSQPNDGGFGLNEVVTIVSALIALAALVVAWNARQDSLASAKEARDANQLNRQVALRQGLMELHMVWYNIATINPTSPIVAVDVLNAEKALQTTASLWNHKYMERTLIAKNFWNDFKEIYDAISHCEQTIPGDGRKCSELISPEIQEAYHEMAIVAANKPAP